MLAKQFERFLGCRDLSSDLEKFMKEREQSLEGKFFRGLPFPTHLLKVGAVIEEWHGSTHWTLDEKVAQGFANDYMNECYYEELQEELGVEDVDYEYLVLVTEKLQGVESYKLLKELNINGYEREQEITVLGKDFVIESIEVKNIDGVDYYYATVSMQ